MRVGIILFALAAGLLFSFGCGREDSSQHPLYRKGEQLRKEGNPVEAESYFRRYLERVPNAPLGHLALAGLYDESLANPAAALYHYDEYLRLIPADSPDRATVEQYRELVRAKLLRQLSGEPLPELPAVKLAEENEKLRLLNEQMKLYIVNQNRKIAELQKRPAPVPVPETTVTPSGDRTYIVQSGDTPGKIALRFYGSSAKYKKIMEANGLTGAGNLHIGQKLVIPTE